MAVGKFWETEHHLEDRKINKVRATHPACSLENHKIRFAVFAYLDIEVLEWQKDIAEKYLNVF
jgi:hypothetical protein